MLGYSKMGNVMIIIEVIPAIIEGMLSDLWMYGQRKLWKFNGK